MGYSSLSSHDQTFLQTTLGQVQDCARLVNETCDPAVFFKRLNMMLDFLLLLQPYERYGVFRNCTPTQGFNKILANLDATVDDFISRSYRDNQAHIAQLKTEEARQRNRKKYILALDHAFHHSHEFWTGNRGKPHYTGPLFTPRNYQRVQIIVKSLDLFAPPVQNQESISSDEYQKMRQAEEDWLEAHYDFNSVEGIERIPVRRGLPTYPGSGVTGQVEYYLLRKAAGYEKSDPDLAIACYKKANALMPLAETIYEKDRYLRLPRYLRKLRRFDEARVEEAKIALLFPEIKKVPTSPSDIQIAIARRRAELLAQARNSEYNLIEASYARCVCSECAKYRERVYCIAGENRKYPTLPDHLLDPTHDCGIILWPVIEDVNSMFTHDDRDLHGRSLVKYSNRPFIDDRTPDEIKDYQTMIAERAHAEEAKRRNDQTSREYDWLWEFLPEMCPKSLSGYSRMKKANSDNFQKLKIAAVEKGFEII